MFSAGLFGNIAKAVGGAVGLCSPSMADRHVNSRLSEVLDNEPVLPTAAASGDNPETTGDQDTAKLYEEHTRRVRAEADAADKSNRLRVAQEQLAEYANQKEEDARTLLQQADAVSSTLSTTLHGSIEQGQLSSLLQQLQNLRDRVAESALEAQAFAAQQRADVERLKRSSQQAELPARDGDADWKRPKDENADKTSTTSAPMEDAATTTSQSDDDVSMNGGSSASSSHLGFTERAKYIPIRLGQEERRLLRLLEAALNVSEYTDKVDILSWRNKSQRIHVQIKDICAILSGLVVAQDYKRGQQLVKDKSFKDNEEFFQDVFEVGRRYKIMNPDKMRSEYGKLMYLLMDSSDSHIQELLDFKCVQPLKTVHNVLETKGCLKMLEDPLMGPATAEIIAGDRPRHEVQRDIKIKERAREQLSKKYRNSQLSEEEILKCLYSISDNNSFLLFNRDPIERIINYFTSYFSPNSHESGYSLAIQGGREGARLTHSHERQYHYVLQSLTLWREISTEMFKLWYLAEQDLLREGNDYRLCDTGQGLNRVQSAPSLSRAMHAILARCQARIGSWVGSSVVHLGDHNVPNAFMFIDKYTQVPRILNPVALVMEELPKLYRDKNLRSYIDNAFGGVEECRKEIMLDFCRHAFDGSGADNFFDAGSCIDGRLTSAWNWCSKIEKKSYYHIFRVAGFVSFDGEWK